MALDENQAKDYVDAVLAGWTNRGQALSPLGIMLWVEQIVAWGKQSTVDDTKEAIRVLLETHVVAPQCADLLRALATATASRDNSAKPVVAPVEIGGGWTPSLIGPESADAYRLAFGYRGNETAAYQGDRDA